MFEDQLAFGVALAVRVGAALGEALQHQRFWTREQHDCIELGVQVALVRHAARDDGRHLEGLDSTSAGKWLLARR
jgi:hypothetical protein